MPAEDVLRQLDALIATSPPTDRPALVVALAARLAAVGAGLAGAVETGALGPDESLDIGEAARRIGCSTSYAYRHAAKWPFSLRVGRTWRFSAAGLERWRQHRMGRT